MALFTCQNLFGLVLVFLMFVAFVLPIQAQQQACTAAYGNGATVVTLATGSPGELGLVEVLSNEFCKIHDVKICWRMAGSGESLKLLQSKEVDLIMVHAPAAEKAAVQEGWASQRTLIGSNEFYIVGPPEDPAKIEQARTAAEAYTLIANTQSKFLSRGDNSGTHTKEMAIWKMAGIEPSGEWYIVTKDFMLATLKLANEIGGYFMTDSSSWVQAKAELPNLKILFRGDRVLINTYHALRQPEGAASAQTFAAQFVEFLGSEQGQKIIGSFGQERYGEALYNDAVYARQYVD